MTARSAVFDTRDRAHRHHCQGSEQKIARFVELATDSKIVEKSCKTDRHYF